MSPSELLEGAAVLTSIVGVWFALVGWKLVPLLRGDPDTRPEES